MTEKIRFERGCVMLALNPEEFWFVSKSVFYPLAIRCVDDFETMFLISEQTAESFYDRLRAEEKAARASGTYWSVPRIAKDDASARRDVAFPDIDEVRRKGDNQLANLVRFSSEGAVLTLTPEQYGLVRATMRHALANVSDNDFGGMLMSTRFYAERLVAAIESAEADAARRGFVFD